MGYVKTGAFEPSTPDTVPEPPAIISPSWSHIPQEEFNNLLGGMKWRCHAVIDVHGGYVLNLYMYKFNPKYEFVISVKFI